MLNQAGLAGRVGALGPLQVERQLRALGAELHGICLDRVRHPDDVERVADLQHALLEGVRILALVDFRYGGVR